MSNTTSSNSSPASFAENSVPTEAFSPNPAPTLFERFNRSRIATVAIFAVVAAAFYLMNFWTPYQGDDYSFNFVAEADKYTHRVESVGDLLSSWKYHYLHNNGRFADDGCVRPTHFVGKNIFNFLNTAVFVAFLAIVSSIASRERKIGAGVLVFAVSAWFFLLPQLWMTSLWQTGVCNYLWTATAALLWITLFLREHERRENAAHDGKIRLVVLFFVSLICAWFHEGVAPVVSLCAGIYCLLNFKKMSKAEFALALGFFAGTALVVFSPGIIMRATRGNSMSIPPLTLPDLAKATANVFLWSKFSVLLVATLCATAVFARGFLKKFLCEEIFLVGVLAVSLAYNIFLRGAGGERNCFFGESVALILVLKIFLAWKSSRGKIGVVAVLGAGTIAASFAVFPSLSENFKRHREFAESAETTTGDFIPAELPFKAQKSWFDRRFLVRQTSGDANFSDHHNLAISRYYGRKSRVFVAPKKFFDDIYEADNFCIPANEFCDGWFSRDDVSFALKKLSPGEIPPEASQIKYVWAGVPDGFLSQKVAEAVGLRQMRNFDDLGIPRVIEMPTGRYLAIPVGDRSGSRLHALKMVLEKIEILPLEK